MPAQGAASFTEDLADGANAVEVVAAALGAEICDGAIEDIRIPSSGNRAEVKLDRYSNSNIFIEWDSVSRGDGLAGPRRALVHGIERYIVLKAFKGLILAFDTKTLAEYIETNKADLKYRETRPTTGLRGDVWKNGGYVIPQKILASLTLDMIGIDRSSVAHLVRK